MFLNNLECDLPDISEEGQETISLESHDDQESAAAVKQGLRDLDMTILDDADSIVHEDVNLGSTVLHPYTLRTAQEQSSAEDRRRKADWSKDKIMKFLELYAVEQVIWDPTDKDHRLKHKLNEAWRRISEGLGNTCVDDLKAKKKSLMAKFRFLLKKKRESVRSGAGAVDVLQPMWFAFEVMESFLGSLYDADETTNLEDMLQQNDVTMPPPPPPAIQPQQVHVIFGPPQVDNAHKTPKANLAEFRRPKSMEHRPAAVDDIDKESFDTSVTARKDEDECEIYGKLLAKKLRKYPERMRDRITYKIDGLLLDNPYPDERTPTQSPTQTPYHHHYYQNFTPLPNPNVIPNSPIQVNMSDGTEAWRYTQLHNPTGHNYYVPPQTLQCPVISIPDISALPQKQINILSQEVVVPANATTNLIDNAYLNS